MLRLFRMYRLCVVVRDQSKAQGTEDGGMMKDFIEEAGFDGMSVLKRECLAIYRPWLSKSKRYVADETFKSAVANGYIKSGEGDFITLTYTKGGGADLAEGYGWGFVRELIAREWKYISILLLAVGWAIGYLTAPR